jgi:hypothetical protein
MTIAKSPIANLLGDCMRHYAKGNVIQVVTKTGTNADKDLGIRGTIVETIKTIEPEPFINAIKIDAVNKSGGAFRYSDFYMTVSRDSLTSDIALDNHTEFNVNGDRYKIVAATPGPSAWAFVIRRKVAEPVTP